MSPEVLGELERLAHQQGQSLAGFIRHHLENITAQAEASAMTSALQDVMTTSGQTRTTPVTGAW
jgi:hypothetical protein